MAAHPVAADAGEHRAPEIPSEDVINRALSRLKRTVDVIARISPAEGRPVFNFVFSLFQPDPMWPHNLHAFPVPAYREGTPVPPDGSPASPILIAVNLGLRDDEQALGVASYLVATLRRQAAVADVIATGTNLASLTNGVGDLDRISHAESIAMARALLADRRDEVAIAISRWGFGVSADVSPSWLPDRAAFAARVPFLARCYNELPVVRDAVDRIVAATVGVGPRVSSLSEEVRRLAERANADAKTGVFAAHAIRDAVLMGAGAVVMDAALGRPQLRLVRPDRLELTSSTPRAGVVEIVDSTRRELPRASVMPGAPQPGSLYGASILDPWTLTLYSALEIGSNARAMESRLPPPDARSVAAAQLAETIKTAKQVAAAAEASLADLLRPVTDMFPPPRYPLYLRGHETWP